jgi:hypothetical protein
MTSIGSGGRASASRGARAAFMAISLGALLLSCSNILSGKDITEDISSKVDEATADKVSVTFVASPSSGGSLSLNGQQTMKVGIAFNLTAAPKDAYSFGGWSWVGAENVRLSSKTDTTTTVTVVKAISGIKITGRFVARPYVLKDDYSPKTKLTGVPKGDEIYVPFSEAMRTSTFSAASIKVTGKLNGDPVFDPVDIFDLFTLSTTSTSFTLTPIVDLDPLYHVFVVVTNKVRSEKGISPFEDFPFDYVTGN